MPKTKSKPTIFFYVSGYASQTKGKPWFILQALASDGVLLDEIESPELNEGKIGIGYAPNEKDVLRNDELFNGHFPKGFNSEWVDKPPKHKELQKAIAKWEKNPTQDPKSKSEESDNVQGQDQEQEEQNHNPAFIKRDTVRRLPIEPPESELAKYFKELAEVTCNIDTLKEEIKEFSKGKKDDINILEKRQKELCTLPTDGKVLEDVECTIHYDWEASEKSIFRNDTNELVDKEPITLEDKQLSLNLGEGGETGLTDPATNNKESEGEKTAKSESENSNKQRNTNKEQPSSSQTNQPPTTDPKEQVQKPPITPIQHPKPPQAVNLENDNPEKNRIDARIGVDWEMIAFEQITPNMLFKVTWFKENGRDSNQIYKAVGEPEGNKIACELWQPEQ